MDPEPTTAPDPWRCPTCGNWLVWNPAKAALNCLSCGGVVAVTRSSDVTSHPFHVDQPPAGHPGVDATIICRGCGATQTVKAPVVAGRCSYCRAPFVAMAESGADPQPDGVVAAAIDLQSAQEAVHKWAASRRFAPADFKSDGNRPQITLAYQPYWAFDTDTMTSYQGERAETVTLTRTTSAPPEPGPQSAPSPLTTVKWHPAGGTVRRKFTNVGATAGGVVLKEAVWDFSTAERYSDDYLVGASVIGATIPLPAGWKDAIATMASVIEADIQAHIGGTDQRIGSVHTAYRGAQYRYLLAPAWSGEYHWQGKDYKIDINAETGGVTGQRPWSKLTIALAAVVVIAVVVLLVLALLT